MKIALSFIFLSFFCSCTTSTKNELRFDAELSQYQYPYEISTFTFSTQRQNLKMRYGDLGNKLSSKVVVLLHGKNFAGYYWDRIARKLVAKGYRVIIPDQIGFGKSSKPRHYQYSFGQLAYNTYLLLNSLGIKKFILVGHSMGGMLATHMATMRNQVQKLILVNPIGLEKYLNYVEYKDPEFFYQKEINKTVSMFRNYQKKNYYDGKWSESYEKLLTPFKGWKNGPEWNIVAWNNALTYGPIFSEEIVSKFSELKIPTTLILGTRDRTGPGRGWKREGQTKKLGQYQKLGMRIMKLNPQKIKLIKLKGLGHMPHYEDFERFSEKFFSIL